MLLSLGHGLLITRLNMQPFIVTLCGLGLVACACLGAAAIDASWNREQFYIWQALQAIGQPSRRLGSTFTYCSTGGTVRVEFDTAGRVTRVVSP